jgi:predicted nuclease of predicted toxin-antitoxin system
VVLTALTNEAILVHVDKDMKRFAQKYGTTPTD